MATQNFTDGITLGVPLPAASGGMGTAGGAWTSFTPTIGAGSGAFTTVSATGRKLVVGKLVHFQISIVITTNGTAGTLITATLPVAAVAGNVFIGKGVAVSGKAVIAACSAGGSALTLLNYDGTYPGASGETIHITGVYEST